MALYLRMWLIDQRACISLSYIRPRSYKLFSCSTQLSTKFILLINVKMPTIVGILTFISKINTTSETFKARNFLICLCFSFYEQLKIHAELSWAWKKFYNLGALSPLQDKRLVHKAINFVLWNYKHICNN